VAVICNSGCDDFLAMPFPVKRMLARVALLLH
jgi:DNA-binding response OmpR family regulator